MSIITAKYSSRCPICGGSISPGAKVEWSKDSKAIHEACASGSAAQAPAPKASKPRAAHTSRPAAPPEGPMLRTDREPYQRGAVVVAQLSASEVAACEARQSIIATEIPGDPCKRSGDRRVAVVVIHTDRMSQDAADDNGYCGRYGAVVRLASPDEAAEILATRTARQIRAAAVKQLVTALTSRDAQAVSDIGHLPPEVEREATLQLARGEDLFVQTIALTATQIVGHHGGHYDDYRSTTYTIPRTEELAVIVRQLARPL